MRINDSNLNAVSQPGTGVNPGTGKVGASKSAETQGSGQGQGIQSSGSSGPDRIHLSKLAEALAVEQPESPEREARLERLAALVAKGEYHPDPEKIAEAMVKDALVKEAASGR